VGGGDGVDFGPAADERLGELEATAGAAIDDMEEAPTLTLPRERRGFFKLPPPLWGEGWGGGRDQRGDRLRQIAGGRGAADLVRDHADGCAALGRAQDGLPEVVSVPPVEPGRQHDSRPGALPQHAE